VPALVRPSRSFSFSDWSKSRPREQLPGDRLDAQIENLIEAIASTQSRLAEVVRDDGKLKNQSVGPEQLTAGIAEGLAERVRTHTLEAATRAEQGAATVDAALNDMSLLAADAEHAAIAAAQFLAATDAARLIVQRASDHAVGARDATSYDATESENWANYSKAQADNAIKAKDEALAWAEFLAGPVVDGAAAPAYIAASPFPHGLYYQPVEGYGGVAGLWSAKWWAVYAAQLVGPWGYYYLGGWTTTPIPGDTNPATGIKVPNPLAPGSMYYDLTTGQLMVWNGSQWVTPLTLAAGVEATYTYVATAGQTVFSGNDIFGKVPVVGDSPSEVHVEGLRLVEDDGTGTKGQFTVNDTTNELTLLTPASAGDVVQWDLLVPVQNLAPGIINAFKVTLTPAVDGATTVFTMTYVHPVDGIQPVDVTDGWQLQVSIDGVIQEPGVEYVALDNVLTIATAPVATARMWVVWFKSTDMIDAAGIPEAPNDGKQYARQSEMWTEVAMDGGAY
jgi:hypothetical protein